MPNIYEIPESQLPLLKKPGLYYLKFFRTPYAINNILKYILLIFSTALLAACSYNKPHEKRSIERSFYFWKSVFKPTTFEKTVTGSINVKTIYLKFFDVNWNENTLQPEPAAQVNIVDTDFLESKKIIPVVFITNECIYRLDSLQAIPLAEKISTLMKAIILNNHLANIPEIQIDCDWTVTTKDKYFTILKKIKELSQPLPISATIRLHQVKYIGKSGIPPVDRGLLMCYNMGNLKDPATDNSILETKELKKYTGTLSTYPLPLDVALPLFEWKVLFRFGKFKGLIQNLSDSVFKTNFVDKKANTFIFLKDTLLSGYDFKKGDIVRNEKSDYNEIMSTAKEISNQLSNNTLRVSLFHLDSLTLRKYPIYELENIYSSLR
ncbi:MAG: hypothetical protein ABIP30_00720 [Ferruginibacter sp.]